MSFIEVTEIRTGDMISIGIAQIVVFGPVTSKDKCPDDVKNSNAVIYTADDGKIFIQETYDEVKTKINQA